MTGLTASTAVIVLTSIVGFSPITCVHGFSTCLFGRGGRTSDAVLAGQRRQQNTALFVEGQGEYYGESGGSYMVREFSMYEQLEEIVKLASQPLPERPDGIVCIAKYSSSTRKDCRLTEAAYERLARDNPATIFLRCFEEYENSDIVLGKARIQSLPTFDVFYGGNRVARVEGPKYTELEELIQMYQFQNSKLDLFSEQADSNRGGAGWGDGKRKDATKTPRTTNRFIPGYDWNTDGGFFDGLADKAQDDFERQYGEWVPNVED